MELILIRKYYKGGTNGVLHTSKREFICYTIELPWRDNKPRVSCIPEGTYELKMRFSRRFGTHFIVQEVKGRSLILLHPANNAIKELRGCIAPVTTITGEGKGLASVRAFNRLKILVLAALEAGPVYLTIKSQ